MKKLLLLLVALLTGVSGAWAYDYTTFSSVKDKDGNALSDGGYYRILLPKRGASVALQKNGNYINAHDGLAIVDQIWKVEAATDNMKVSTPSGGYWKTNSYSAGTGKVSCNGTSLDFTSWRIGVFPSGSNLYTLFDQSTTSGAKIDGVDCGWIFSNHSGKGYNMGFYNDASDNGCALSFERFYKTTFTFVDGTGDPVSTTVKINGSLSVTEFYTNSTNQITSFGPDGYVATYSINDVTKTAE